MTSIVRFATALILSAMLLCFASPILRADSAGDRPSEPLNVLVTITKGTLEGRSKKPLRSFNLVTREGEKTELLAGSRVPIATTRFQTSTPPQGEIVPMTSFTYQNVGFTAQAEVVRIGERIHLNLNVEESSIRTMSAQPQVETRHQSAVVVLDDGVPLEFSRTVEEGGTEYWEVIAKLMK